MSLDLDVSTMRQQFACAVTRTIVHHQYVIAVPADFVQNRLDAVDFIEYGQCSQKPEAHLGWLAVTRYRREVSKQPQRESGLEGHRPKRNGSARPPVGTSITSF
jgi:hypothetical protein